VNYPELVTDEVCNNEIVHLPQEAISISRNKENLYAIDVRQEWTDSVVGLALRTDFNTACVFEDGLKKGDSMETYNTRCVDGIMSVTAVLYLDDNVVKEECDACNVEEISDLNEDIAFCAYRIEIPCDSICDQDSMSPSFVL